MGMELNILALVKGEERYVFVYDDDSQAALLDALNQQAANPELTLNWFDAVILTQKAEEQVAARSETRPETRPENLRRF